MVDHMNKSDFHLLDLLRDKDKELFSLNGKQLVKDVGFEIIRGIIYDVLTGKNLRDSTEVLTRKRIVSLNLATLRLFINGTINIERFIDRLPELAFKDIQDKNITKSEKWLANWILGLTEKEEIAENGKEVR